VNYLMPAEAFGLMMGLSVSGLIINWATISLVHLRFRRTRAENGQGATVFPSPVHPLSNWLCLVFLAGVLVVMYLTPGLRTSVYMIPAWLLLLCAGYAIRRRRAA